LLLINPVGQKSGYLLSKISTFSPLGLAYVAAVTPDTWDVSLMDENFTPFSYREADLVAISAFTSSINRAYEIAAIYRGKGTPVVIGGIHASMWTDEVKKYADSVVVGEVESVWADVLSDFEKGALKKAYAAGRVCLVSSHVKPRREILNPDYFWNSIQTSRGCPFDCTFCSVSRYLGTEYRQRTAEDVLDELAEMEGKYVAFMDDNLIGYSPESRERAKTIFHGMIDRKLKKRWWMQTSINAVEDEECLKLAAKSGCMFAFVGFESVNSDVLKELKKGVNLKIGTENYKKTIRTFHKYGIAVMGGFILGIDHESESYYNEFARYLFRSGIDVCQISLLTPLPGTQLYEKMEKEGRLFYTNFPEDWDKYRLSRIVHHLEGVTEEEVYAGDNLIKRRIYSPLLLAIRMIRSFFSLWNFPTFFSVYKFNKALKRSWKKSYYYQYFSGRLNRQEEHNAEKKILNGEPQ